MYIISILNLKGGTGKTATAINTAKILSKIHNKRVLLVDADPQSNVTKFFNLYNEVLPSMADLVSYQDIDLASVISHTDQKGLDIIPSNMDLDGEDEETRENLSAGTWIKDVLQDVKNQYDYCIIDCHPALGLIEINAMVAADQIIIPIKIDKNSLDGMERLAAEIEEAKEYNPSLKYKCLITMYTKNVPEVAKGAELLRESRHPVYDTMIRYSDKMIGSTFDQGRCITEYSPWSAAAIDYKRFALELKEGSQNEKV